VIEPGVAVNELTMGAVTTGAGTLLASPGKVPALISVMLVAPSPSESSVSMALKAADA